MRIDRHFIEQQWELAKRIESVKQLGEVYAERDRNWPVSFDTETTALDFGVPNVLFDPARQVEISRQLYPVVFGISLAVVTDDGKCWLCWGRRGSEMFDLLCDVLASESEKLWHNAKYDLGVCQANGIEIGGKQNCSLVMSRLYWNRLQKCGLKEVTKMLCPKLAFWDSPIAAELERLKRYWNKQIKLGEVDWHSDCDYRNYSFVADELMGRYAVLDVFMPLMIYLRLSGEANWRTPD